LADEVFDWVASQPLWQQDLARRLVAQHDLDEEELAEALAVVRAAFGLPVAGVSSTPRSLQREELGAGASDADVRLRLLGSLEGVGMVSPHEQLTFNEVGLTIVYGTNGAGKSTYVKVLKKLCRTVDADCPVRGNIYDAATPDPSAKVEWVVGGDSMARRTPLTGDVALRLSGMSVFDSACAELYVDEQNTIQYIPTELRLLARLASLQDTLRQRLAAERESLQGQFPELGGYPVATTVGRAVRALTGGPGDVDLASLATLNEAEQSRLAELRHVVAAAMASNAKADAAAADGEADQAAALADALEVLGTRADAAAAERLRTAAAAAADAQEAVELAARQLRGPVPGIGGGPWQVMWNAARTFIETGGGAFPPAVGSPCPLCLQPVDEGTAQRMAHFQQHITGAVHANAGQRAADLAHAIEEAAPAHAEAASVLPLLHARHPALATRTQSLVSELRRHLEQMVSAPADAEGFAGDVCDVADALRQWASSRAEHASTLREADDAERLPSLQAELAELEARERLHGDLDDLTRWQGTLREIGRLEAAFSALATNRITTAQRALVEGGLAKDLDAALSEELGRLRCALPVQTRAQIARAQPSVALRLLAGGAPRVSDIASEGERRALALAFFLAELAVANDGGGIVLDDPVSSLDDERRFTIALRLIEEAARRQVIVFTHDLPFVFELRRAADKAGIGVHIQNVWRYGPEVGRVDAHPPFRTMRLRERIDQLSRELTGLRSDAPRNNDEAWRRVDGYYARLRTSWERAIEERLFGGVVERFERDVQTLRLRDVQVTPENVTACIKGMTDASRFVHEDAYAAPVTLPTVAEMQADLSDLQDFERRTRPS
jgi:ABC-type cobalamin/Fe3+-siderophores transport system ATPase subunit